MADKLIVRLQRVLVNAFPEREAPKAASLKRINEGWESDVYSFRMDYGPRGKRQRQDLILRIYPGEDAQPKSAREYGSLSLLHRAGYPVPEVFHLDGIRKEGILVYNDFGADLTDRIDAMGMRTTRHSLSAEMSRRYGIHSSTIYVSRKI